MKASLSIMIVVRKIIRKRVPRTPVRYIQNSGWLKNFPSFRSPNSLFLGFQKLIQNWINNFGSKNSDQKIVIKNFGPKILNQKIWIQKNLAHKFWIKIIWIKIIRIKNLGSKKLESKNWDQKI